VFTRSVVTTALLREGAVGGIGCPAAAAVGESLALKDEIESTTEAAAQLRLCRNNSLAAKGPDLITPPGKNQFILAERRDRKGVYTYRAEIESPESDTFRENNVREAIVKVEGRPKTLYLYGDDKPSAGMVRVLRDGNFNADIAPASGLPTSLSGFQD